MVAWSSKAGDTGGVRGAARPPADQYMQQINHDQWSAAVVNDTRARHVFGGLS